MSRYRANNTPLKIFDFMRMKEKTVQNRFIIKHPNKES